MKLNGYTIDHQSDLSGANLSGLEIVNADITQATLAGANLAGSKIVNVQSRGASFERANLVKADLVGEDLEGVDFRHADLSGADLSGANLRGANLMNANLSKAIFRQADLAGAYIIDGNITQTDFSGANFHGHVELTEKESLIRDGFPEKAYGPDQNGEREWMVESGWGDTVDDFKIALSDMQYLYGSATLMTCGTENANFSDAIFGPSKCKKCQENMKGGRSGYGGCTPNLYSRFNRADFTRADLSGMSIKIGSGVNFSDANLRNAYIRFRDNVRPNRKTSFSNADLQGAAIVNWTATKEALRENRYFKNAKIGGIKVVNSYLYETWQTWQKDRLALSQLDEWKLRQILGC